MMLRTRSGRAARQRNAFLFGHTPQQGGGGDLNENPSFIANLQATLVPSWALGSDLPTFTRATTAYQIDFEGKHNLLPAGAARMQGARVVQNLCLNNFSAVSGAIRTAADAIAPDGTLSAAKVVTDATANARVESLIQAAFTGRAVNSVWLKSSTPITLRIGDNKDDTRTVSVTSTWTRFSVSSDFTGQNWYIKILSNTGGEAVTFWYWTPQAENLTGATDTNPSETTGSGLSESPTPPFPYYGAGLAYVRYLDTLKANTVNAGTHVVTEATGAYIDSSQAACAGGVTAGVVTAEGPVGILVEGARQNITQGNTTLTVAGGYWEQVGGSGATSAMNAVGPDSVSGSAATVTATADNTGHWLRQGAAHVSTETAGTVYTKAFYIKQGTGTYALVGEQGDVIYRWATLKWSDLSLSVTGCTATKDTLPNGWYRINLTYTRTNTSNSLPSFGIANTDAATIGNANGAFNAAGTETVLIALPQTEAASFASSPIITTTAAATRNADVEQSVSAGNISATATSITMHITPTVALTAGTEYFHWASYVDANNYTALLSDGTNLIARKRIGGTNHDATIAWNRAAGTTIKAFARFDTTHGVDVGYNGTLGTPDATTTASQIGANFQIGADGNGASQDFCEHRFFVAYRESIPLGKLEAATA